MDHLKHELVLNNLHDACNWYVGTGIKEECTACKCWLVQIPVCNR